MPAFYCGIFSHKPTTGKLDSEKILSVILMSLLMNYSSLGISPLRGISFRTGLEKETMVCPGPMCKYAEDLIPFLKVLLRKEDLSKVNLDAEVGCRINVIHPYPLLRLALIC